MAGRAFAFNAGLMYEVSGSGVIHYSCLYFEGPNRWVLMNDEAVHVLIKNEDAVGMFEAYGLMGIYRAIPTSTSGSGGRGGTATASAS
jgi:hypothetical protein